MFKFKKIILNNIDEIIKYAYMYMVCLGAPHNNYM